MTETVAAQFDTVGIAVPIEAFDMVGATHTIDGEGTESERHRWSRQLPGGGFLATGFANKAWIEASIPKRVDPEGENIRSLPLVETIDGLAGLYAEAAEYLEVDQAHRFEESKLVRVDLVRDFSDVEDLPLLLDGLGRVEQPGRSKVRRFADPARGQAESLRVGPRAWACSLYDKHAETGGKAPAGSLRFEARLHGDQLSSRFARDNGGLFSVVGDLAGGVRVDGAHLVPNDRSAALDRAQRAWFERAGFDRRVTPRDEIGQLVRRCGLKPAKQGTLWAYLTLPGFAADLHRNTRRVYRNLAVDLGVCPASNFTADDLPVEMTMPAPQSRWLDYNAGTSLAA